ncbi:methyltransferase domain-containing protein [Paenibacillus tundrae]
MSKYDYEVDLTKETSASKIIKLISGNSRVLEIGCASGYMTKILREEKGCVIDCVEINEDDALKAQVYCNEMLIGDIEKIDFSFLKSWGKYDYILFADVLEHLKHPKVILEKCKDLLNINGQVIASIPNMAHSSIVFNLLKGDYNYQNIGLLDNTHLKFYTKKSIVQLFEESGYFIKIVDRVKIYPQFSEFSIDIESYPDEIINYVYRNNSEADTYQFILYSKVLSEENRYEEILKEKSQIETKVLELQNIINHQKDSLKMQIDYSEQLESLVHRKDSEFKLLENELENSRKKLESQIDYNTKLKLMIKTTDEDSEKLESIVLENETLKDQINMLKDTLQKQNEKYEDIAREFSTYKNSNWFKKISGKI